MFGKFEIVILRSRALARRLEGWAACTRVRILRGSQELAPQDDGVSALAIVLSEASLPGLTRQSILLERLLRRWMDARVKPAHDASLLSPPLPRRLAPRRQFYARRLYRRLALQLVELRQKFAEHGEVIFGRFGLGAERCERGVQIVHDQNSFSHDV
jgi:hypothetical protein